MEWCFQRLEDGKYADQKYLDAWPENFQGVKIIKNIGANLAVWNIRNYKITLKDKRIQVNNLPLIFYHFAGLKQVSTNSFKTGLSSGYIHLEGIILNEIYKPYVEIVLKNNLNRIIEFKKDYKKSNLVSFFHRLTIYLRSRFFNDEFNIDKL